MTGRGLRARDPVNYNDKQGGSMQAAWIKTLSKTKSATPAKKTKKRTERGSQGSAEKENAATKKDIRKQAKPKPAAEAIAEKPNTKKVSPPATKAAKSASQPARGRNSGVTVVPIADKKTPKVSGLRKPEQAKLPPLPKPPAAPKSVPGLPGVVLQPVAAAAPSAGKRKAPSPDRTMPIRRPQQEESSPSSDLLPPPKHARQAQEIAQRKSPQQKQQQQRQREPKQPSLLPPPCQQQHQQQQERRDHRERASKRSRTEVVPPLPSPPPAAELAAAAEEGADDFAFSPLPPPAGLDQIEAMRRNFFALKEQYDALRQEHEELKTARIREDVELVLQEQAERVDDLSKAASGVAAHWKAEAQRLQAMLDEGGLEELAKEARTLRSQLATAQQALIDVDVAAAQKDKAVVELQKRNEHLERWARVKQMVSKCVGTEAAGVSAGVQAPSAGVPMMQARAMAPEGVAASGSMMYPHGGLRGDSVNAAGGGAGAAAVGVGGLGVDAPFSLQAQRTVPYAAGPSGRPASGSDMQLASGAAAVQLQLNSEAAAGQQRQQRQQNQAGAGGILTAESVQQRAGAAGPRGRRVPAPPAPLPLVARPGQTAADVSRQIKFYSNSGNGGLPAVQEEAAAGAAPAPAPAAAVEASPQGVNGSVVMSQLSVEQRMEIMQSLKAEALRGGRCVFTHHPTGFKWEEGPAPGPSEEDEDDPEFAQQYRPLAFGTAQPFLAAQMNGVLLDEFTYCKSQEDRLRTFIFTALAQAREEQQRLQLLQRQQQQ